LLKVHIHNFFNISHKGPDPGGQKHTDPDQQHCPLHPNIFTSVCVYGSIVGERGIALLVFFTDFVWKTCSVVHKYAEISKGGIFLGRIRQMGGIMIANACLIVDRMGS
jgi:hypothetical protein